MNELLKKRVVALMREKNITQMELAEIAGTTQATLSRNLNGVHEPKAEIIEKISNYFNVSSDYLLGISDDRISSSHPSAKDQLKGVQLALFNQVGELTEEQAEDVLQFINFIKSKDEK